MEKIKSFLCFIYIFSRFPICTTCYQSAACVRVLRCCGVTRKTWVSARLFHCIGLTHSHKKKRMREIKKLISRGVYDKDGENPFDLFVSSTEIRWCYYKESKNILGQTYGMLVLQDFESLTANLLCRTIETVEGGGIIAILLKTMSSLKQFYGMVMVRFLRFPISSPSGLPRQVPHRIAWRHHPSFQRAFHPLPVQLLHLHGPRRFPRFSFSPRTS